MKPLENQTNVFGDPLQSCSLDPLTGFFRTGCCDADSKDIGKHFVCARVNDVFLKYSLSQGNDLVTPRAEFNFSGLRPVINGASARIVGWRLSMLVARQRLY